MWVESSHLPSSSSKAGRNLRDNIGNSPRKTRDDFRTATTRQAKMPQESPRARCRHSAAREREPKDALRTTHSWSPAERLPEEQGSRALGESKQHRPVHQDGMEPV